MDQNSVDAEGIYKFSSIGTTQQGTPELMRRVGALPDYQDLNLDAENPQAQPKNPGVIMFTSDIYKDDVIGCLCTRDLNTAEKRLINQGDRIICAYPTWDRDSQGKRFGRGIRRAVHVLKGNVTTFFFRYGESAQAFIEELGQQVGVKCGDYKITRMALKALVRRAIKEISLKNSHMTVKDIVQKTMPAVDGLDIDIYLNWLVDDGLIKYVRGLTLDRGRVILLH